MWSRFSQYYVPNVLTTDKMVVIAHTVDDFSGDNMDLPVAGATILNDPDVPPGDMSGRYIDLNIGKPLVSVEIKFWYFYAHLTTDERFIILVCGMTDYIMLDLYTGETRHFRVNQDGRNGFFYLTWPTQCIPFRSSVCLEDGAILLHI